MWKHLSRVAMGVFQCHGWKPACGTPHLWLMPPLPVRTCSIMRGDTNIEGWTWQSKLWGFNFLWQVL